MNANPPVATTPEIDALLAKDAVVAVGVSAGKDSEALAIAIDDHLQHIGHTGPKTLIHADLGRVEWRASGPKCEELAKALGWDLIVTRRQAGDMMDRWLVRWDNNKARYLDLSCVQLILPWSTPSMRFCTSELKTAVIRSELKKKFPQHNIINATGIRRQESANRAKMPVAKHEPQSARKGFDAYVWNAVIDWSVDEVFAAIAGRGLTPHEAYTRYGMTRVSCAMCIMSSASDLYQATTCPDNHAIYREMVELEVDSTFAFQSNKWLGDVRPDLLNSEMTDRLEIAKRTSARRKVLEAGIPKHLLYAAGWPTCMPTVQEAELLAEIRLEVAAGIGLNIKHTTAMSIIERYEELTALKLAKGGAFNASDDESPILIPTFQIPQQAQFSFF
ncbi:phosphoadenosine phosphosulfate reductase family protein [Pseudomonas baetica]|uniref:phosphoadenosine phosphosulfate reductase family protein n=1 Tax=Pseudomonas baetica TaxID=674054 RepID=UPI00240614EA|nr:phosphoadenosine phosphosulfate reductase family protein [Pseudomonas baetica]MDF9779088.1 3'-phosphoadenosine 5'-phosphosulfate sulfotransferase (PAPS reductase)/FAD synthetase [Pseudomonas baetica]